MDLLQVSQEALDKMMERLEDADVFLLKLEMDEEEFVPIGLEPRVPRAGIGMEDEKESKGINLVLGSDMCNEIQYSAVDLIHPPRDRPKWA